MIGGRKSRSNKGKKRTPYGPRSRTRSGSKFRGRKLEKKVKSKKVFSNNVSNVTNNAPVIRAGTNVRPTFNTMNKAQRKRKVRSNKGKKRTPYGPRSRTRSGKKFKVRGGWKPMCGDLQLPCREAKIKEQCGVGAWPPKVLPADPATGRPKGYSRCVEHFMTNCNDFPCETMGESSGCCDSTLAGVGR